MTLPADQLAAVKAAVKTYGRQDREELKAYQRAYYAAHKDELKARRSAKKDAKK